MLILERSEYRFIYDIVNIISKLGLWSRAVELGYMWRAIKGVAGLVSDIEAKDPSKNLNS